MTGRARRRANARPATASERLGARGRPHGGGHILTPRPAALAILVVLAVAGAAAGQTPAPAVRTLILSTTTSTQDSGLLDVLIPMFEQATGYSVKTISVGTGHALALAARGEADVTLAHAPALEKKYVEDGKMLHRRLVMYNDFVVVGPAEDPAQIKGRKAADALPRIAQAQARFVSRGDKSGTHLLEQALWKAAGVEPRGAWYIECGQGMGQTLLVANERHAYTLTDRGTYLAFQKRLDLPILVERDRPLLNIYSVMEVNPANGPRVNAAAGKAFADFMLSPAVQAVIKTFGVDKYGQPLFVPIAGQREDEVGG
jgi:tungstate transport system substrate-binding protein